MSCGASSPEAFGVMFGDYIYGVSIEDNAQKPKQLKYGALVTTNPITTGLFLEDSFDLSPRLGAVSSEEGLIYNINYPFLQKAGRTATDIEEVTSDDLASNQSRFYGEGVSIIVQDHSTGLSIVGMIGIVLLTISIILLAMYFVSNRKLFAEFINLKKQKRMSNPVAQQQIKHPHQDIPVPQQQRPIQQPPPAPQNNLHKEDDLL